ncbi:autophagy-related protein 27 [Ceratobasidium sp. AG-Ba]|nr:autophagy-related protein 27 [Ceratobasidium sp. AG-Ba]
MIVPWRRQTLLLLLCVASTLANSGPFDCKADLSGVHYDFTLLGNDERTVERDRSSPPSTMHDVLRFNICKDLGRQDGVKDVDQCSQGIRACFTTTNKKPEEQDRIVSVVPLAQSADDYTIQPFSSDSERGVTLVLNDSGPQTHRACGSQGNNDPPKSGGGSSPPDEDVGGSSMGWFFFILLVVIAAYFGFGAYHNYNQYGASGWDLIPYALVFMK